MPAPVVNGSPAGGAVTLTIDSGSPLAAVGGAALVDSPGGRFLQHKEVSMPDSRMLPRAAVVALGLLVAPAAFAGQDKVPARLAQARYVALAYDLGDSTLSETEALKKPARVLPEDREALQSVRNMIEKWGRYVITVNPGQAELLIAVRAGRRASLEASVRRGGSRPAAGAAGAGSTTGSSYRGEASSGDDMLSVYDGSALIWREQRPGGLSGRSPALFEDFKADVERSAKHP